jgi:hypothetical protein
MVIQTATLVKIVRDPRSGEDHVPKERVAILAVIHGMKKITVSSAGGGFTQKEQPMPEPGSGYAKVKVQACGVCHSDALTKEAVGPGITSWHATLSQAGLEPPRANQERKVSNG